MSHVNAPYNTPIAEEVFNDRTLSPTNAYPLTKWKVAEMQVIYWLNSMKLTTLKLSLPSGLNMAPDHGEAAATWWRSGALSFLHRGSGSDFSLG